MRKVLVSTPSDCVDLNDVPLYTPIFVSKDGVMVGILGYESNYCHPIGWGLIAPRGVSIQPRYATRELCIEEGLKIGYEFFTE